MVTDPVNLMVIAMSLQMLAQDLGEWPPIGGLLAQLELAVHRVETLDKRDAQRLTDWAFRWKQVDSDVRAFYNGIIGTREALEQQAVDGCLWDILGGRKARQWQRGIVSRMYRDAHGAGAPMTLTPKTKGRPV
jgi:hypothetical protein